jgi:hypothetical protein
MKAGKKFLPSFLGYDIGQKEYKVNGVNLGSTRVYLEEKCS